jgi:hypothetical protein
VRAAAVASPACLTPPDAGAYTVFRRRLHFRCSYTLGGIYLARYDDSPAGAFDEARARALARGSVCARALTAASRKTLRRSVTAFATAGGAGGPRLEPARLLRLGRTRVRQQRRRAAPRSQGKPMSPHASAHALTHAVLTWQCASGPQEVGLPSYTAAFEELPPSKDAAAAPARLRGGAAASSSWWHSGGTGGGSGVVRVRAGGAHVCTLALPAGAASSSAAAVPHVTLSLPSFSGATAAVPGLLRYALRLRARVRPCAAAAATMPLPASAHAQHALHAVLAGRPLLTLAFDDMEMHVGAPTPVKSH